MILILFILLILSNCLFLSAQDFDFQFQPEAFPVTIEGWQPYCPWAGGDSETAPEFCDIDADGVLDLFVGSYWGTVAYFENDGTENEADFNYITREYAGIDVGGTIFYGRSDPVFVDIDGDGDFDIFTSDGKGLIHYWKNIGTAQIAEFIHITDSLEYIDELGIAHVDLIDIDNDEDYDIFIGDNIGRINFYENIGTPDSFDYIEITSYMDSIDVGEKASPCFVDIDADNDYDLFIGEGWGKIWYYRNEGDSINYDFTYVTNYFEDIDVGNYASPEFADIDGDGDYDLFVGGEGDLGNAYGDVWFYENIGTPEHPSFQLVTKNYLTFDISNGSTIPQLIDINGDGLLDLMIGASRTIHYFQNVGTTAVPSFIFMDDYFQGVYRIESHPFFVDLDADGDYDLLMGESAIPGPSTLALYLNMGTPEEAYLRLEDEEYITNPQFHLNIQPSCADIDADGDYDLFITDDMGHYFYYQNNGTPQSANFGYVTSQWQGLPTSLSLSWRTMCFCDLDDDGDLDLLQNNFDNINICNLEFYRNTGIPQNAQMVLETEEFLPDFTIWYAEPCLADIDNDGDLDLFCGEMNGGVMFFRNLEVNAVENPLFDLSPLTFDLLPCYPNPFNEVLTISFTLDQALPVKVAVFDNLGRIVSDSEFRISNLGENKVVWNAGGRSSGVYFVRLEMLQSAGTLQHNHTQKVLLLK